MTGTVKPIIYNFRSVKIKYLAQNSEFRRFPNFAFPNLDERDHIYKKVKKLQHFSIPALTGERKTRELVHREHW